MVKDTFTFCPVFSFSGLTTKRCIRLKSEMPSGSPGDSVDISYCFLSFVFFSFYHQSMSLFSFFFPSLPPTPVCTCSHTPIHTPTHFLTWKCQIQFGWGNLFLKIQAWLNSLFLFFLSHFYTHFYNVA